MTASTTPQNKYMALLTELLTLWFRKRTWSSALYLLLGLPLGIVYFTFVVTATSLSVGMIVSLVGIPLLVGTFIGVRMLAKLDVKIGNTIQGTNIVLPPATWNEGSLRSRIVKTVNNRATWKTFAYMLVMLPLGTMNFVVAVTLSATGLTAATSWIWSSWTEIEFTWTVDFLIHFVWQVEREVSFPWQAGVFMAAGGLLLLIATPAVLILMANAQGRFAKWMLSDQNDQATAQ